MPKIAVVTLILLVVLFGGLGAASFFFYDMAVKRSIKDFLRDNEDLKPVDNRLSPSNRPKDDAGAAPTSGAEWVESQPCETWQITSADGLRLVGYYLPAGIKTTKTVILAHGYSSKGKDMGSFARFYAEKLGYNVLMPDSRGHGYSEGDYIGFGWPDRKDYLLWIQKIIERVGVDAQIALHGISMGGATVMMVSGEKLPKQVKVIVEDCGYTSVYDQLAYQLKRMYKSPPFPIMQATSIVTKIKTGYSFYEASALKQVAKSTLPMLFIHGSEDQFVPSEMVWRLYDACQSEKEIYVVEGAGHGVAYSTNRSAYEDRVADFVGRFVE